MTTPHERIEHAVEAARDALEQAPSLGGRVTRELVAALEHLARAAALTESPSRASA